MSGTSHSRDMRTSHLEDVIRTPGLGVGSCWAALQSLPTMGGQGCATSISRVEGNLFLLRASDVPKIMRWVLGVPAGIICGLCRESMHG